MQPMESVKITLNGFAKYRGSEGHWSFILHRITGLGTLFFLTIHILDTSTVYFFPALYEHAINIYRSTPFILLEIILVFSVIYHGVNGARIAISDLYLTKQWQAQRQRISALWTVVIAVLLWLPAAILMARNLLVHNFGL